jgi:hypothetical protein
VALQENNLEVIRCWILARERPPWSTPSRNDFVRWLDECEQKVLNLSGAELVAKASMVDDPWRRQSFLDWSWVRSEIALSDFGPWRTVGNALPLQACHDSAIETAAYIRDHPDHSPHLSQPHDQDKYRDRVRKIHSITGLASIIRERPRLSMIVAEHRQRGRGDCRTLRFSSEDGSNRAIGDGEESSIA